MSRKSNRRRWLTIGIAFLVSHQMAWARPQEKSDSPRIRSLKAELEKGQTKALERFWSEIEKVGAPLVEPIANDSEQSLVTFLWRSKEDNKYIAVFPFARPNPMPHLMTHLSGTDLWYKSYKLRRDARFEYQISVNDSLAPFAKENPAEKGGWIAALQPDPLNPHRFVAPVDPEFPGKPQFSDSILELSDAPAQPFVNPRNNVEKGQVQLLRYTSTKLHDTRRLWVYTPAGYTGNSQQLGLLILLDGWEYTTSIPTPIILDNMISDGVIGPVVAVMVDQLDRADELSQNPEFTDFMANELVPWCRRNYNVTGNPHRTVIGGVSLGGLAAAYIALRNPEIFGNVLSQSGSFQIVPKGKKELIRQFAQTPLLPVRFYLEAGLLETGDSPSLLHANRTMRDVLEAKGYTVNYSEFNGRHDDICWRGSLSTGLISLLGALPDQPSH